MTKSYLKATELLGKASSEHGFLASANEIANYKRVWARDGVICGLAGMLDGEETFLKTFKNTLISLAKHQHKLGNIPSNIYFGRNEPEVSFGGLAGRVDTITWFVIGVCNYCYFTEDDTFFNQMKPHIERGFQLLNAWEFNNNHLLYVPRSGNWADEYITEAHIFYDQLLRLWALRGYQHLNPTDAVAEKIEIITKKLVANYKKTNTENDRNLYHPRAFDELQNYEYWMASITPSGYQTMFDAFGNSLAILLKLDTAFNNTVINYSERLRKSLSLQLLPAFWEVITKEDNDWRLLEQNNKYEFRNHPYEFHNGGTWQMVNGFYAAAISDVNVSASEDVLKYISKLNEVKNYAFYENFNSKTGGANGVPNCTWSAAGEIIATQFIKGKRLLV